MRDRAVPRTPPGRALETGWPREFGAWFWHLFVLPADEELAWPAWAKVVLKPPLLWLAARLGVANPRSLRSWILSLVLVDPPHGPWSDSRRRALPRWRRPLALPVRIHDALLAAFAPSGRAASIALRRYGQAVSRAYERQSRAIRWLVNAGLALVVVLVATTPLAEPEQLLVLVALWLASVGARLLSGPATGLVLIAISLVATARYVWWRVSGTLTPAIGIEWWLSIGLVAAEAYTWLVLTLGYLQNARPLGRGSAALPAERSTWPTVDVLIPTFNEPLAIVRPTVLAALSLDWPRDKLKVWLLDDGRREALRTFAAECGAGYLTRADNRAAKAGNLNHALALTHGEFVAVFDADHIPVRTFLTATMGWFGADPRCALVQTPHHFFSADPFERNLGTFRRVPNEGGLFYGLVQDGNDLWNAAFFCGSCAVLRRAPLMEIGGIATDSVTEDAHTALRLHRHGYTSAYLRRVLAAGLATESLAGHIRQRARWARGMAQIFRIDNPLGGKGLTLAQRMCYLNAMLHFFSGLPRLVFLTAPLSFLFFEFHVINAAALTLALYALPHLMQAAIANSYLQRQFRHSIWNEAYEAVLSWYIVLPTLAALLSPRLGKFNVTAKGGVVAHEYFDWRISAPYQSLVLLNLAGVLIAVPRLLFWNTFETGTVTINLLWALFNLTLLGTALGVATETRQVRRAPRVEQQLPARLHFEDGSVRAARTLDYSMTGLRVAVAPEAALAAGRSVGVGLDDDGVEAVFRAETMSVDGGEIGLQLLPMSLAEEQRYLQCTFARPDAWTDWSAGIAPDRPLASFAEVLSFGATGYARLLQMLYTAVTSRLHGLIGRLLAMAR